MNGNGRHVAAPVSLSAKRKECGGESLGRRSSSFYHTMSLLASYLSRNINTVHIGTPYTPLESR